jgi:hypothetical protein
MGRAHNITAGDDGLEGDIHFATAEENPAADAVYRMVKAGYLNSVSVGFLPLEWAPTKDKSRPGGVDFKRQSLLEISIVPIPANPNAIALARAAGIEVDRLALIEAPTETSAPIKIKSLWHVAYLADLLDGLGILEDCVEWESEYEGDDSSIPQQLTDAMKTLGQILIDMTIEEVTELLADPDDVVAIDSVVADPMQMSARASRMKLLKSLVKADKQVMGAVLEALAPKEKGGLVDLLAIKSSIAIAKAGKVLSSDNEKKLRDAHDMLTKGCEMIMGVVGAATPAEDTQEKSQTKTENDSARNRRQREIEVLRLAV